MDSRLKILLVANGYPPDVGGWEVYNGEYARRLASRGHDVCVYTWRTRHPDAAAADAEAGLPVHRAEAGRRGRALDPVGLAALVRERRPDVVLVSGGSKSLVAAIRVAARRAPVVVSVHDLPDPGNGRGSAVRWWYRHRFAFDRADRVVANSRDTRERVLRLGVPAERVAVVYPGVDLAAFAPDPVAEATSRDALGVVDRRVLLTVGGLRRIKGHARVIDALPALRERVPGLVYLIVGDGKARVELRARAAERGVADIVRFAGRVRDARPYFHACDVFVMPSVPRSARARAGEGFGIAYAEAAACGKPAVASSSGGGAEVVIDGETGRVVDPEDDAGLLSALEELLSDPPRARRLGEAARRHVGRFDWERGTDALEAALRGVV